MDGGVRGRGIVILANLAVVVMAARGSAQSVEQVSVADDGSSANFHCNSVSVSDDGMRVAFASGADNLVAGDTNHFTDVFVRDRRTGTTIRVNVSSSGAEANDWSLDPVISGDGNVVVFGSFASNLVANDSNHVPDVFVHDLTTGATTRASIDDSDTKAGNNYSYRPAVSFDGRYVAFTSDADNLVAGDTNGKADVFVRDRVAKTTVRANVATDGHEADEVCGDAAISRDGRFVTFTTFATNFDPSDTDGHADLYLRDLVAGTLELVSVDSAGVKGDNDSTRSVVSDDGRFVAFQSTASNLVAGDDMRTEDVFVRDRNSLTTTCASVDSDEQLPPGSLFGSGAPDLNGDGRFVVFHSSEDQLVPGDQNRVVDLFVRETLLGVTTLSVRAFDGGEADGHVLEPRITGDGAHIAFLSAATNLVDTGSNGWTQAFVVDRRLDAAMSANYGVGLAGTLGVPTFAASQLPTLHAAIDLQVGNSWGAWTVGLLLIGTQRAQLPTSFGGDLLVLPTWTLLLPLPPGGGVFTSQVPADERYVGVLFDLQVLELDPGAIDGTSFTAGLELGIGY